MSKQNAFTDAERTRLLRVMKPVLAEVNDNRRRPILKQVSKRAQQASASSAGELKNIFRDDDATARLLVAQLEERSTQHIASQALSRLIEASWKSQTVSDRARQTFFLACVAFRGGRWKRLKTLARRLDEMQEDDSTLHPLLTVHRHLTRLSTGSPERVRAVAKLEGEPIDDWGPRIELPRSEKSKGEQQGHSPRPGTPPGLAYEHGVSVPRQPHPVHPRRARNATPPAAERPVQAPPEPAGGAAPLVGPPVTGENRKTESPRGADAGTDSQRSEASPVSDGPKPPPESTGQDTEQHAAVDAKAGPTSPIDALTSLASLKQAAEVPKPSSEGLKVEALRAFQDGRASVEAADDLTSLAGLLGELAPMLQRLLEKARQQQARYEETLSEGLSRYQQALGGEDHAALAAGWKAVNAAAVAAGIKLDAHRWPPQAGLGLGPWLARCTQSLKEAADAKEREAEKQRETEQKLAELAAAMDVSVEELQARLAAPPVKAASRPEPPAMDAALPSEAAGPTTTVDAAPEGVSFGAGTTLPKSFRPSFLLEQEAQGSQIGTARHFLPQTATDPANEAAQGAAFQQVNGLAAHILRVAREHSAHERTNPSLLAGLIGDAATLVPLDDSVGPVLLLSTLAVLSVRMSGLNEMAAKRVQSRLLRATSLGEARSTSLVQLGRAAGSQGMPSLLQVAIDKGCVTTLVEAAGHLTEASVTQGRRFGSDLAIAAAGLADDAEVREHCYSVAILSLAQIETIESWLTGFTKRKRRQQPPLSLELPAWLSGYVERRAACYYETEARGVASVNASVPSAVARHGLFVEPGEDSLTLPVLVRNAGKRAASNVVVRAKMTMNRSTTFSHRAIAWLARSELVAPNDAMAVFRFPLPDEETDLANVSLVATCTSPSGKESTATLEFPIAKEPPDLPAHSIPGLRGAPIDLEDDAALKRSSSTVRDTYALLRDSLRRGEPVRCMVFGRRRRGKSSIRNSIHRDRHIAKHFVIESSEWNSARMDRVTDPFRELGALLVRALGQRDISVRPFTPEGVHSGFELYQAWKTWLAEVAGAVRSPVKVLLLIDEFQKWVAALPDRSDRQRVLSAFRDFNDGVFNESLSVSFALFGLKSLRRIAGESNDFSNAVQRFEVRELTNEEGARYVGETLPVDHDGRARERLARISGGNPFVLNLLCAEATKLVTRLERPYLLVSDIDEMLANMGGLDSRLESFFGYMLKQDEDEAAPALPQFTVLASVASLLDHGGDYAAHVSEAAVEQWLRDRGVEFDEGLPGEQLAQLADEGVLERHSHGRRFGLMGEALCRWLAERAAASALQPVKRVANADLVLNRYRQVEEVGRGGQGATVWLAEDTTTRDLHVVLKIYPGSGIDCKRRVEREARLLARAAGRYVVRYLDWGMDERKGGVIVMEWVHGESLRTLLEDSPASAQAILPGGEIDDQVSLMKKLADGVARVHQAKVLHKDLSAKNVLLVQEGAVWEPRLIDFGISGDQRDETEGGPGTTTVLGTLRYMAPEKLHGAPRSKASDVYSLGVLFVDLVLPGGSPHSPRDQVHRASIPAGPRNLILEMLAADPVDRPSAEVVVARLEGVLEPEGWEELSSHAAAMYLEKENLPAALALYRRALAEVPAAKWGSDEVGHLLGECLECIAGAAEHVDWWGSLFDDVFRQARGAQGDLEWHRLAEALSALRGTTSEALSTYDALLSSVESADPSSWLSGLLHVLGDQAVILERLAERYYAVLVSYCHAKCFDRRSASMFAVKRSHYVRESANPLIECELWLKRARRIHPDGGDYFTEAVLALERAREATGVVQSLPADSDTFEFVQGKNERGHDRAEKMERFARKINDLHPYVGWVHRIRKQPNRQTPVPIVLPLGNIASAQLNGVADERIIPFLLDASFARPSGGREPVPILMAMVLAEGTTASQRLAAHQRLSASTELFPG
jgi:hypothetical protein